MQAIIEWSSQIKPQPSYLVTLKVCLAAHQSIWVERYWVDN